MESPTFLSYSYFTIISLIERNQGAFGLISLLATIAFGLPPIVGQLRPKTRNLLAFLTLTSITFFLCVMVVSYRRSNVVNQVTTPPISVSNLLACLGNTGGEQRHIQLFGCLEGVSLPATTTAQQIIDILGTIPRDSTQWHDDLVDLLKNNKITISGQDATRLLSAFGSEQRRSSLIGVLCYIKRPISDSDKNELLKGIDPMYVSYVRQQLAEPTNLPCEN